MQAECDFSSQLRQQILDLQWSGANMRQQLQNEHEQVKQGSDKMGNLTAELESLRAVSTAGIKVSVALPLSDAQVGVL